MLYAVAKCHNQLYRWLKRGDKLFDDDGGIRTQASWVASSDGDHYTMPPLK